MRLWVDPKSVEKLEINAKIHCGGGEVTAGTHTGGSISIREHCKKLAVEKGQDPTPSEMHLHVRTHGHDGKSFLDERAQAVHLREEKRREECMVLDLKRKLTNHMLPIFIEQERGVISTPSHEPNTPNDNSSAVTPIVPPPPTANVDEFDPSLSDDDRSLSPMH
ncbi:uncharacterized protein LOC132637544 [Lycium barbarum]|uniref:uncharacterized protein LOC132637544 n=1 Tax=Lycium barbarum TaxID=112863 RepID=UPI00293E1F89|nr:uncharacterized protein LOC132637544 [Lycium barbarum]